MIGPTYALTHPSFSGLFVTCAHRPHTTFPPAVTIPNSLTFTSTIVPLVSTPNCVYMGFCGFFFTLRIGSCTVTASSGCVTLAFLYRRPMGRMKRSYFTGRRVKSGPTEGTQSVSANQSIRRRERIAGRYTKSRLCNHAFPPLLRRLLPRLHNLEHLLLAYPPHLRQWHAELRRLLIAFLLDLTAQCFGFISLAPIQQVLW